MKHVVLWSKQVPLPPRNTVSPKGTGSVQMPVQTCVLNVPIALNLVHNFAPQRTFRALARMDFLQSMHFLMLLLRSRFQRTLVARTWLVWHLFCVRGLRFGML